VPDKSTIDSVARVTVGPVPLMFGVLGSKTWVADGTAIVRSVETRPPISGICRSPTSTAQTGFPQPRELASVRVDCPLQQPVEQRPATHEPHGGPGSAPTLLGDRVVQGAGKPRLG